MNSPKMLPWLANTAGIELERAEELWQQATEYAVRLTGEAESKRYLRAAHEHMMLLVENEVLASKPVQDAPWLMIQAHLSVAPMIVADIFAQAAASTRQLLNRIKAKGETPA